MSDTLEAIAIGISVVGSVVAVASSVVSQVRSRILQKQLKKLEALQLNATLLNEAWRQIAETPSVLKFHSISKEELREAGIKPKEIAYLLLLFEAADFYYQHISTSNEPFPEGSLRYEILKSPETRKAWGIIKRFFVASKKYSKQIEATIKKIESAQAE